MTRVAGIPRLSSFKTPSRQSREYIYYRYYFKDLKDVFDTCIKENDTVFDIGCGNKPFEAYIRTLIKNYDASAYRGCDIIQSSGQKVDIICDVTNIAEKSSTYDIVICTQVIEHVFEHSKVFEEAYRLLKPGGFFIVSSNLVWEIHEAPYDYYRFTKYGFIKLLENAGFNVQEAKSNGGKFAVLGQLILHVSGGENRGLKRVFYAIARRCLTLMCNMVFPLLDDKFKDDRYTLNYVFAGKKQ
ncbi:MAG: class I SAM-dependent methyltransferase [Dysgonamonadaceae bacterium]|jgi:SAM-dependent methyltransferase|nr:class I SAM-dependent methyltransferase [Dysgonamonadaceae bacterium]